MSTRQKVTTTDDTLQIYRCTDLSSNVVARVPSGHVIELGDVEECDGREWISATLEDGTVGYLLAPSARGHTTLGGAKLVAAQPAGSIKLRVNAEPKQTPAGPPRPVKEPSPAPQAAPAQLRPEGSPKSELKSEVLLRAASPDLFRLNAFRITGLPVDATASQITRQVEKLRLAEKFGGASLQARRAFVLDPPPDGEQLRTALQRLHDPEVRLIDEFFWFWPREMGDSRDEGLTALAHGDEQAAAAYWSRIEAEHSISNVSMHNLAVLAHLNVLDLDGLPINGELSSEEATARARMWNSAFRRWKALLENEGFWSRLTRRIHDLDDPRLTTGSSRRIRESLPLALLSINARLASRAALAGNAAEAARQLAVMRESGFDAAVINSALRGVVEPIREQIKTVSNGAEKETAADVTQGAVVARRLHDQMRLQLAAIDCLLPAGDAVRDGAHDEVALQMLGSTIAYGNKTDDWRTAVELLEQALPIAASASARGRIELNLKICRDNKISGTCHFCEDRLADKSSGIEVKVHGNVQTFPVAYNTTRTIWNHSSVTVPRCKTCAEAHRQWSGGHAVAFMVTLLSLFAYLMSLNVIGDLVSDGLALTLYVVGVCAVFFVPGMLSGATSYIRFQGIKPESMKYGHASLQKRKAEGWKLGAAPPGSFIPSPSATIRKPLLLKLGRLRRQIEAGRSIRRVAGHLGTVYIRVWLPIELGFILVSAVVGLASGGPGATAFLFNLKLISANTAITRIADSFGRAEAPNMAAFGAMKPLLHAPDVEPSTAVKALTKALETSMLREPRLKIGAAEALADMGREARSAAPALEKTMREDGRENVRDAAAAALVRVDPERAVQLALTDLEDSSPAVRRQAAARLAAMASVARQATPALSEALRDGDAQVRSAAELALSKIAPETVIPRLIRQLRDSSWQNRRQAAQLLGEAGAAAKPAIPALRAATLDRDSDVRKAAEMALRIVDANIPQLVAQLKSPSWTSRQEAAQWLGHIGPEARQAAPALEAATADPDPDVSRAAREALRKIKGER